MKLTYFQLEAHLAKKLAAIYIVSGDELFLKYDALSLVRKAAKQAGMTERSRLSPETSSDWEQLYPLLYSRSLLAEKRLIELDCSHSLPNKAASKILQEYSEHPESDLVLLLDMEKVDAKVSKSAWYQALEKAGIAVTIWPIPREQLPQWISQRALKFKLRFNSDAAAFLADYVEGNLSAAAQTIEKMVLLQAQSTIDIDLLKAILTDESHFTVFDFIENLIAGDKTRTLHILASLKNEGVEPVLLLWGITRELRLLAELAQQIKQGHQLESLFQTQRIFARRQQAIRRFLSTFSVADCWRHLTHAAAIDQVIKGAVPGDVWMCLQLFCLRMV